MKITKWLPIIGILIFAYIIIKLDIRNVLNEISNARIDFLLIAAIFVLLSVFTETLKWFAIARVQKIKVPFFQAVKINLIGSFYGFITPSKVGGVMRAKYLKKYDNSVGKGIGNFIFDKVLDVLSLVFLAVLFSFVFKDALSANFLYYSIILLAFIVIFIFIFSKMERSRFLLRIFYRKLVPEKFKEKVRKEFYSFYTDMPKKRYLLLFFLLNLFNWAVLYAVSFFAGKAVGMDIPFFYFLAILPIATLVGQIPITMSGLGTREATLISLFGLMGIEATKIFSMAMISLFIGAVIPALIGGLLSFKNKNNKDYKQN